MKRIAGLFVLFALGITAITLRAQAPSASATNEPRALLLPPIALDDGVAPSEAASHVPPLTEFLAAPPVDMPPSPPIVRGAAADDRIRPLGFIGQPATLPSQLPWPAPAPSATPAPEPESVIADYLGSGGGRRQCLGVEVGASFYYLRPFSSSNVAYRTSTGLGTVSPQTSTTNFGWNYEPALAGWLGYTTACGVGGRVRWFHFDEFSNVMEARLGPLQGATTSIAPSPFIQSFPLPPGGALFGSPGLLLASGAGRDQLSFSSRLRLEHGDALATYVWDNCNWHFNLGVGGRYLHMTQTYDARLLNNLNDGGNSETQALNFNRNFNGGGPLVDFQANWKLIHNLAMFSNVRGALVVGRSTESSTYFQSVVDLNGVTTGGAFPFASEVNPSVSNVTNSLIPILELEVGLEYGHTIGRCRWFIRSAVVNQTYFGAGNASRSDGNLSMFGFQGTVGLDF